MMLKEMAGQLDVEFLHSFIKFLGPMESRMELRAEPYAAAK